MGARGRGFKSRHPDRSDRGSGAHHGSLTIQKADSPARSTPVKSTVETLSPTRVRLSVEVPFADLDEHLRQAYRTIGEQVRVPGFRPGKVPQRLIDQRIGRPAVLEEAAREAIPQHYLAAVREHEVKVLGPPSVEITKLDEADEFAFTAEVDIRPEITLPDLTGLSATVDELSVPDEEVDEQVGSLRDRFATLKGVERPAQDGDFVQIDLVASVNGEEVPGGSASGVSHEVGSKKLLDGLDEALVGMSAGESKTFVTQLVGGDYAGQDADVSVAVKTVRERELPELNEDFAQLASEFDTLDELREDVRTRVEQMKRAQQAYQARDKVLEALREATEVPAPEGVVAEEVDYRRQAMADQLERIGSTLEDYFTETGKSEEEFASELTDSATEDVRTQILLDAIADAEEVGVDDTELTQEVVTRAQQSGMAPQEYADQLQRSGQLRAIVADVRRGKALAIVVDRASITDTAGNAVDLSALRQAPDEAVEADVAEGAGDK
ncbi:MAG: trigger factor [Micromonosporaceae bacterium]|nr:trigger factor [Micromonosporaceae bacterium]